MISRIWHGWTKSANADTYEALLKSEIFTGIHNYQIAGYRGIHFFRQNIGDGIEFVMVMWFNSIEAVRAFAGTTLKLRRFLQRLKYCFRDLMHVHNIIKSRLKLMADIFKGFEYLCVRCNQTKIRNKFKE